MKTAVVTGATGGLGSAIVTELGAHGFQIVGLYSHGAERAEGLERAMTANKVLGRVVRLDVTQPGQVKQLSSSELVMEAKELLLINNACAAFVPKPFHLHDWDEISRGLEVAAKGSFLCTSTLLRQLVAKRGTVVNVLSRALVDLPKGFSGYVVAKSALLGMTRALAAEYDGRLRVFSVSPGFMDTPLTAAWDDGLKRALGPPAHSPIAAARRLVALALGEAEGRGEDHTL